ncbi:putative endo-1,3(4)-beta-glucanase [Massariosphaeria phaeospora]|uniref:endo-1,3(4)-beta-glucanase n=1 Tax=Massariosphaeria phaeospora TaxID=100035 RepID=A0A7C8M6N6_9PLEO|nr:putative endo-1,3(4)-beta-glucanase [Massariosphaeria phaeospora]
MSLLGSPGKQSRRSVSKTIRSTLSLPDREHSVHHSSRLKPNTWSWRTWLVATIVTASVIIGVVVTSVLGARANAYPDYYRIEYQLQDTYTGDNFFSHFSYFTGDDPTHGFVHYVDAEGSATHNLTQISSNSNVSTLTSDTKTAILRVDTSDTLATSGRRSVRITSTKTYSTGLFIFDVLHIPYGCGTWPALWLTDPSNWPENGEIDVIEAVNTGNTGNHVTLHTSEGCKMGTKRRRKQTGKGTTYNCWNATNGNVGCGVTGPPPSFGEAFNAHGGGIYALEVRSEGIRVWLFDRDSVPSDLISQQPDPSMWPTPLADFPHLECDVDRHFRNMSIIANIALCGDWAGREDVFGKSAGCEGTCEEWVAQRGGTFGEAFWEFGGWWVYGGV